MLQPKDKIYNLSDLKPVVDHWKKSGETIVFTNGVFDILHQGHLDLLKFCKTLGHRLLVGLNTDRSVRRLKGEERPIHPESLRSELMASLYYVDGVTLFDEDTPLTVIQTLMPDYLVKGGDYIPADVVGYQILEESGGQVVIFNFLEGHSTTNTIEKIKKQK